MRTAKRPEPVRATDNTGNPIVRVPMDRKGDRWATLDAEDFDRIVAEGVSMSWHCNDNGAGQSYVKAYAPEASGGLVSVPRIVMRAGPKEVVRYVTRDRLDLRRGNLTIAKGKAKREDVAIVRAAREAAAEMRTAA